MAENQADSGVTLIGPAGDTVTVTSPAAITSLRYGQGYRPAPSELPSQAVTTRATPRPKPVEAKAAAKPDARES